jgi:hypothetical protein
LCLSGVTILNENFDADFFFKNDRLEQVMLSMKNTEAKSENEMDTFLDDLFSFLCTAYGDATVTDDFNIEWTQGNTMISLVVIYLGGEYLTVNIVYQKNKLTRMKKVGFRMIL